MHILLGSGGPQVLVALAPGLIEWVAVTEYQRLAVNDVVLFQQGAGTIALDGEREIELSPTSVVEVQLWLMVHLSLMSLPRLKGQH